MNVVWGYFLKKGDVLFRVKPAHVMIGGTVRSVDLQREENPNMTDVSVNRRRRQKRRGMYSIKLEIEMFVQ